MRIKPSFCNLFVFSFCLVILSFVSIKSFAQTATQDTTLLRLYKELPESLIKQYDSLGAVYVKFAGYTKMENKTLTGLVIHTDPDFPKLLNELNIERTKSNHAAWFIPKGFILRRYKDKLLDYTTESLGVERLGYKFAVYKGAQVRNNENAADTLVVFKSNPNRYYGYLVSDIKNREKNILLIDSLFNEELIQRKKEKVNAVLGEYKNKIFPENKLYLYKYYKVIDYGYDLQYFKRDADIYTMFLEISNTNNLDYVKQKLKSKYNIDTKYVELFKSYDIDKVINTGIKEKLVTYGKHPGYLTNNSIEDNIDISKELKEYKIDPSKLDTFKKLSYWNNKVPKSIEEVEATLEFDVQTKREVFYDLGDGNGTYLDVNKLNINTYLDGWSTEFTLVYPVKQNYLVFNGKKIDPRIDDDFRFSIPFLKSTFNEDNVYRRNIYQSTPAELDDFQNAYAVDYLLQAKATIDRELREELAAKKEAEESKKRLAPLYAKYGKQFVDAANNLNIIIGMHEDLLEYPLRAWTITRRTLVPNGYILYCTSMLNSRQLLTVKVLNKKVVYVKW